LLLGFPSVVFWTALALKDAWTILFLMASLWCMSEFVMRRNGAWLAAAILVLLPLETVRLYILVTGAFALLAVPFAFFNWGERLRAAAGAVVGVYLLFAWVQPFNDLGPNPFYLPIFIRDSAAQAARSSYVEPYPVIRGEAGDRFQVAVVSGATPAPGET